MTTHEDEARQRMVHRQLERRDIRDQRVLSAMARMPRHRFVPPGIVSQAYADRALAIDCGQTISQPYIVALMTQALKLSGNETVLEIGTGSGYQTAILAELAHEVISLERHAELSNQAGQLLTELGYRNITLSISDGTLGWPDRSPYDRIIVTAAAAKCPRTLLDQLKVGGILVIPIGSQDQQMLQTIQKTDDSFETLSISACRFVPLIGAQGWPE